MKMLKIAALTPLLLLAACKAEVREPAAGDETVQMRGLQWSPADETNPGGSHCKSCIMDLRVRDGRLELCVETAVDRIAAWFLSLPLGSTWYESNWTIWNGKGENICPDCTFTLVPDFSGARGSCTRVLSSPLANLPDDPPEFLWMWNLSNPQVSAQYPGDIF